MQATTNCFLIKEGEVLLAMKKRGFGAGKLNGVGGKVDVGEDVRASAAREIKEEIGVEVGLDDLDFRGKLIFEFSGNPLWNQEAHIFVIQKWVGSPVETEEMKPSWFSNKALPLEKMWVDDPHWVPLILQGKKVNGKFLFSKNGEQLFKFEVSEVPS